MLPASAEPKNLPIFFPIPLTLPVAMTSLSAETNDKKNFLI
jgi:hypothetical protein